MERNEILFYEELQSNAFTALQILMYDGWSVRFGGDFTYRVNCAVPMYPETLPPAEKLRHVEQLYATSGLAMSIFKFHDGMDPERLADYEQALDHMGYATERHGNIYMCDLGDFVRQPDTNVTVETVMSDRWLDGFLTMNGTPQHQRQAASAMIGNIRCPIAAAAIWEDGKMSACGLGVMERGRVGLYDIYVDASCRRRGLGGDICTAIMQAGKAQGAEKAYLQVLSDNFGARKMYHQLGYYETYAYWFRTKKF